MTTYTVGASADDAVQASGTVTINGTAIAINAGTRYGGFRFPTAAAPIAQGATITSAAINYYLNGTSGEATDMTWKGEKVTASAQFVASSNNISDRYSTNPTTASVNDNATGLSGGWRSIDVTTIVQELVNQAGWTSTSPITLICRGNGSAGTASIKAFDFGSLFATLTVDVAGNKAPIIFGVILAA